MTRDTVERSVIGRDVRREYRPITARRYLAPGVGFGQKTVAAHAAMPQRRSTMLPFRLRCLSPPLSVNQNHARPGARSTSLRET